MKHGFLITDQEADKIIVEAYAFTKGIVGAIEKLYKGFGYKGDADSGDAE